MGRAGWASRRRKRAVRAAAALVALLAMLPAAVAYARAARLVTAPMPTDRGRDSPWAWEPGMAMDAHGAIWVVGNHCELIDQHGFCQADPSNPGPADTTPLWRSTDGGRTYRFVSDPLRSVNVSTPDRPGGNDTDVAVASRGVGRRPPLIYVVSLWGVSSTLAISGDDGKTWRVAQLTGIPAQDRPWLAAVGPCTLYLAYHPITGSQNVAAVARVERYDGCRLYSRAAAGEVVAVPESMTPVEPPTDEVTAGNQDMAKVVAVGSRVFVAYLTCETPGADQQCSAAGDRQSVHVAVSDDRGASFRDVTLPRAALNGPLDDGTWPLSMATDASGRLAVAVTTTRHVWLWTSRDAGRTWALRKSPVDAVLGWPFAAVPSVAVRGKQIAVAWYGSAPVQGHSPQRWYLVVARSRDFGRTFSEAPAPTVLATTPAGQPLADLLYDDFGAEVTPTGAVALAYTQSCANHRPSDAACPGMPSDASGTADVIRSAWLPAAR